MKFAFLCGSLEPGCDGVGDYTRMLALELIKFGNSVVAIALNDSHVTESMTYDQNYDGSSIHILRIPSLWSNKKRIDLAKGFINNFQPEWLSLQFVSYSFNSKGLPFNLIRDLQILGEGKKWHINFHELWIGYTLISPVKDILYGLIQKQIIKSIVKSLNPAIVTTTNITYHLLLKENKVNAVILPLFSNIFVAPTDRNFIIDVLNMLSIKEADYNNWIFTGTFGNLYSEAKIEKAISDQFLKANLHRKNLAFISFGRLSNNGLKELERLKAIFEKDVRFLHLGEQPHEKVSNLLSLLHTGISCTPISLIGKSGAYAAMKLHGLEVIVPDLKTLPRFKHTIEKYNEELSKKQAKDLSVNSIAHCFLNYISSNAEY